MTRPHSLPHLGAVFAAAISAVPSQERTPLHDGWSFAVETTKDTRPSPAAFRPLRLPATFEEHEGPRFDGVGWYRRTLSELGAADQARKVRLVFHGAATQARVFVNGSEVGAHLGAWTPFVVTVGQAARCDGNDLLEVRLDELVGHNTQGFLPIIQPHFGGLWKDVELERADGPRLAREQLFALGDQDRLRYATAVLAGPSPEAATVEVRIFDGKTLLANSGALAPGTGELAVPAPRLWSPSAPELYDVEFVLRGQDGVVKDTERRKVGFRRLERRGQSIVWNGAPLQVRGVLHWGYEPPGFAPNQGKEHWKKQLQELKALGFNLVKACLWVPPRGFFAAADEVGMLVWQEYPTWHPKLTPEFRKDLVREFDEFFTYDRSHVSTAFRSLTCETGHSADLAILQALYDRAHELVPSTLVVDDSSWIEWNRVHDFWDDHPYGNNSWWPGKLEYFAKFIQEHGEKPLLLGEAITGDTWVDLLAWDRRFPGEQPWWAPICIQDQRKAEAWFTARFGKDAPRELLRRSLAYVMQNRKYQIERFRIDLPPAGYVVSVVRDIRLARMGLYDVHDQLKWDRAAWAWQGDLQLCLDTERDRRAFPAGKLPLALRVANSGAAAASSAVAWKLVRKDGTELAHQEDLSVAGGALTPKLLWAPEVTPTVPERVHLTASFAGRSNAWDLWVLPAIDAAPVQGASVVTKLDQATLQEVLAGRRVLLRASADKGSLRTRDQQFYRGAPYVPGNALGDRLPAQLLYDLQSMDLETAKVLDLEPLRDELDPLLLVWDSHDVAEVKVYPLVAEATLGKGRIVVSTLATMSSAGRYVEQELLRHLATGPAPKRGLSEATIAKLRAAVQSAAIDLPAWELQLDPADHGLSAAWQDGTSTEGTWTKVRAGLHWEKQGFEHKDGIGWYRTTVAIPDSWKGCNVTLVAEGVDDSYRVYVNGKEVGRHGDPAKGITVWLERTTTDVTPALLPGAVNHVVLRVVDHAGAGGIWKPIWLTNGPADAQSDLLH